MNVLAKKRTPFYKILVANRGEIALRIMRTARRLGYGVVAVYSDADREALHVREADQAVRIGEALPSQSYLRIDAIIARPRPLAPARSIPAMAFSPRTRNSHKPAAMPVSCSSGRRRKRSRRWATRPPPSDHAKGRRALRARLSGRRPARRRDAGGSQKDRLSRDDQGGGRRRRGAVCGWFGRGRRFRMRCAARDRKQRARSATRP